MKQKLLQATD
uniref:Uncharacterized protein n=1 Tax=Anguilla anguilla TaxID=7936 RepID=A0A0E9RH02_ANGAN